MNLPPEHAIILATTIRGPTQREAKVGALTAVTGILGEVIMGNITLTKYQEIALGQQTSVGGARYNGFFINAAFMGGFFTHFQGCWMQNLDTEIVNSRINVDGDLDPYYILGASQLMSLRSSDSTVVPAGFPNAAAVGDTGVLRLVCRDVGTGVNGANVTAMHQENALWLAPAQNWTALFDIKQWTERNDAVTIQFSEFGLASTITAADLIDPAKVPAYGNGSTTDAPFVAIKLYGNQGRIICRATTGAALQTSSAFSLPTGSFLCRLEYNHGATSGTPTLALYVNERPATSLSTRITGPLQIFARNCHAAGYVAATAAPSVLDIDMIAVALN